MRRQIVKARELLPDIAVDDEVLGKAAEICIALETDGSRGELTLIRAARSLAALDADKKVDIQHLRRVAHTALGHRLRRNPLDESSAGVRVERVVNEVLSE